MSSLLVKVVFLCAFFPDACIFMLFALRSSFSFSLRVATLPVARKATDRVNYPTKFSFSHYDYHKHHHHLYYFFCFSFSYQNSTFIFLFVLFLFGLVWYSLFIPREPFSIWMVSICSLQIGWCLLSHRSITSWVSWSLALWCVCMCVCMGMCALVHVILLFISLVEPSLMQILVPRVVQEEQNLKEKYYELVLGFWHFPNTIRLIILIIYSISSGIEDTGYWCWYVVIEIHKYHHQ